MYVYNICTIHIHILLVLMEVRICCANGGIIDLNLEDEYYKVYIYIYY